MSDSYRFRLVSLSCDPNYVFSVDGHDMTVIEADGIETKPVTVNAIQIFSAQRYSFVVCTLFVPVYFNSKLNFYIFCFPAHCEPDYR